MKIKNYLIILLISVFIFLLVVPFGASLWGYGGHHVKFSVTSFLYCFVTFSFLRTANNVKEKSLIILIIAILPILLSLLYVFDFELRRLSFLSHLAYFFGIIIGCSMVNYPKFKKLLVLLLITTSIWITVYGYSYWLNYANYGTFTMKLTETAPDFIFRDINGNQIDKRMLNGNIIIFDFWNTACGICFKKFPLLDDKFKRYSKHGNIKFFAVNTPIRRDTLNQAFKTINNLQYSFPVLIADSSETKNFGVHVFPTVIVMDEKGLVRFRGRLEDVDDTILKISNEGNFK